MSSWPQQASDRGFSKCLYAFLLNEALTSQLAHENKAVGYSYRTMCIVQ